MADRPATANKVTQKRLREVLSYDRETGVFTWRVTLGAKRPKGSVAGSVAPDGYRHINIDKQRYPAHWLAIFWETSAWPSTQVDHANGCRDDNRSANLRPCNKSENQQNRPALPNRHAPGVYHARNGYASKIRTPGGERLYLGQFKTVEEAAHAYASAKRRFHRFAPEIRVGEQ